MRHIIFLFSQAKGIERTQKGKTQLFGHIDFDDLSSKKDILPEIDELSKKGSFAVIVEKEDAVELAVDCFRMIPLFYHVNRDSIYISDNADLIAKQIHTRIIEDNLRELYYMQCVTESNETIYKDIFIVNAGTAVSISRENGSIDIEKYYEPIYNFSSTDSVEDLIEEYDSVLMDAFLRLTEKLNGRAILVPLSKGFDSRTVATMLKRVGYDNVYCFSYGVPSSSECAISKQVAENLGYPWLYTEYSGKVWKNFYESKDYTDFIKFSCKGVSIGCLQALPAILNIARQNLVPEDAIVTPGQTDVAFGTNIRDTKEGIYTREDMFNWVGDQYYSQIGGKKFLRKRTWIHSLPQMMSLKEYSMEYMKWNLTERQPGFLINDVRTYEYAGYGFDLPLLDRVVMNFWYKVPLNLLYKRTFQIMHICAKIDSVTKIPSKLSELNKQNLTQMIKLAIKTCFPSLTARIQQNRRLKEYDTNENAFYSFMPRDRYKDYLNKYGNAFTLNTMVAEDYEKIVRNNLHSYINS